MSRPVSVEPRRISIPPEGSSREEEETKKLRVNFREVERELPKGLEIYIEQTSVAFKAG